MMIVPLSPTAALSIAVVRMLDTSSREGTTNLS